MLIEKKGIVDKVERFPGVGASLSSDVSRVAARCGLQREGVGVQLTQEQTLAEGVVFLLQVRL